LQFFTLCVVFLAVSCGKQEDNAAVSASLTSQSNETQALQVDARAEEETDGTGQPTLPQAGTDTKTVTDHVADFGDSLLLFQLFQTNWWDSDLTALSNYLKKASFETCNDLCNITGGREDYYGKRLIALLGLQKAGSLYQSNKMLVCIAKSSYLMRDLGSATQAFNSIIDDGSPEVANYCYQKQLFWKKIHIWYQDYDSAIKRAETILNDYAHVKPFVKPNAHISLATMHLYQGNPDEARSHLEAYLKLDDQKYQVDRKEYVHRMLDSIREGTWWKHWRKPLTEKDWMIRDRERGVPWQLVLNEIINESPAPATPTLRVRLENRIERASNFYHNVHR